MAALATIPEIDDATKLRFAEALARTKNPSSAALQVISNVGEALRQSFLLPNDPIVLRELERLKDEVGEASLLPTKCDIARGILERANRDNVGHEDYERLMKLYCTIMGHIEKPGTNANITVAVAPVMIVKDHGTPEEWAAKLAAQQRGLVLDAAV